MARSSTQKPGRSLVVTVAIIVAVFGGMVALAYNPAAIKSRNYLKSAVPEVLAEHGGESDEEVESLLRDRAIRSSLSMGEDGVEISRPTENTIKVRLRYSHPVDLILFRTRSEFDEEVTATIRVREVVREATVKMPAPAPGSQPAVQPAPDPAPGPAGDGKKPVAPEHD